MWRGGKGLQEIVKEKTDCHGLVMGLCCHCGEKENEKAMACRRVVRATVIWVRASIGHPCWGRLLVIKLVLEGNYGGVYKTRNWP